LWSQWLIQDFANIFVFCQDSWVFDKSASNPSSHTSFNNGLYIQC
jgi:hypothetical protein